MAGAESTKYEVLDMDTYCRVEYVAAAGKAFGKEEGGGQYQVTSFATNRPFVMPPSACEAQMKVSSLYVVVKGEIQQQHSTFCLLPHVSCPALFISSLHGVLLGVSCDGDEGPVVVAARLGGTRVGELPVAVAQDPAVVLLGHDHAAVQDLGRGKGKKLRARRDLFLLFSIILVSIRI